MLAIALVLYQRTVQIAAFQADSEEVPNWRTEEHDGIDLYLLTNLSKEARSITGHMVGRANVVTSEGETLR